ncbi:XTP/dITP diphosphatase [Salibacterium qingdaonense]|uniref:dITP/XTP pyrophosphatase n=1 Tax=Salibacterium qingdaonense TaxID=266892 RepID=A0A1I4QGU4_9BACI|nr:XTP/dITP diphosphatase [Salibacterium qingdaonense]SFM38986.1 XTP/dITP diphosphohydrolase [Salibacterium qingdaonense]
MRTIIIATKNENKVKEFRDMFGADVVVQSLLDVEMEDIPETGVTFEENASLKAEAIAGVYNVPVIADDSGLEIDALHGRPGVYSARYAGEDKNDEANTAKVLQELEGVPEEERTARFVCVIAAAAPGKETETFRGTCEGSIATSKSGTNGFGYDPIFYLPERGVCMAELPPEEKNKISHRYQALQKMKEQSMNITSGEGE